MPEVKETELMDYYSTSLSAVKRCGQFIRDAFYKEKKVTTKANYADLVTETDQAVEKMFVEAIKLKFPAHRFIGEESCAEGLKSVWTDDPTWIIDPIDGTTNFVHKIPYISFSVGLTINKKVEIGIVYNPIRDEMFTAIRGHGATCDGSKICVTGQEDLSSAMFLCEFGSHRAPDKVEMKMKNLQRILEACHGIRCYGSAALNMCEISRGHGDVYVEHGIHCWDIAAGSLIVQEAGGVVLDPSGAEFDLFSRCCLAASSKKLAAEIPRLLVHPKFERD